LTLSVNGLLANFAVAFTQPTFAVFALLFTGAVLVKGRHTVTRMIVAAGIRAAHHARFHRFFSQAGWQMDALWQRLGRLVVGRLVAPEARIEIVIDETAQKKSGAKIYGVGMVYDNRPKSAKGRELEWGLTWVVMSVLVRVPIWKGHVFAVPILARLYRRQALCRSGRRPFRTKGQLALEMIERLAGWVPERRFLLLADGNYADKRLMRPLPKCVEVVSRIRYDAALWAPRPKRLRRMGRPRLHGRRRARPADHIARRSNAWKSAALTDGRVYEVQTWTALWWKVFRDRPIRIVATRRRGSPGRVDFFYTTDPTLSVEEILERYADRWAIEVLFHEVKERMGFEDPQCRRERAVERTAPFLLWCAGLVQVWYLSEERHRQTSWRPRWWAKHAQPSFGEMLAALRREILTGALIARSPSADDLQQTLRTFIESAAYAA
jgi:SRSO17 transposase